MSLKPVLLVVVVALAVAGGLLAFIMDRPAPRAPEEGEVVACDELPDAAERRRCEERERLLAGELPPGVGEDGRAALQAVLALDRAADRDQRCLELVVEDPDRAPLLCPLVEGRSARQLCEVAYGRIHLRGGAEGQRDRQGRRGRSRPAGQPPAGGPPTDATVDTGAAAPGEESP